MKILKLTAYGYPEQTAGGYIQANLNEVLINHGVDIVTYVPTPSRGLPDEDRHR